MKHAEAMEQSRAEAKAAGREIADLRKQVAKIAGLQGKVQEYLLPDDFQVLPCAALFGALKDALGSRCLV
jgi:hypothetical protein